MVSHVRNQFRGAVPCPGTSESRSFRNDYVILVVMDKQIIHIPMEVRRVVIEMFARGYTVRTIAKRLEDPELLGRVPSADELIRLTMDYATDIEQARADISKLVLERGLALKEERLLRLTELAEAYEKPAVGGNVKSAGVYLRTLKQIQEEVEPLGMLLIHPELDPWGRMLLSLREASQSKPTPQLESGQDAKKSE